jgi:hypothetical protein
VSKEPDQSLCTCKCPLNTLRPDDSNGGSHYRVGRVAGFTRCFGSSQCWIPYKVHSGRNGNVEHRPIILSGDLVY